MPDKATTEKARKQKQAGRAPSTQAGEFVREEIHHIRDGKHGARSAKQAIAIGLSKARRAGVKLPSPPASASPETRRRAARDRHAPARRAKPSKKRSQASLRRLEREGHAAASKQALSRQAHAAARRRSASSRSAAAKKAVRTKGPRQRHEAAVKAARTRKARTRSGRGKAVA